MSQVYKFELTKEQIEDIIASLDVRTCIVGSKSRLRLRSLRDYFTFLLKGPSSSAKGI